MISLDRIEELKSEIGPEDFVEIVELFLSESEEMLSALRAAADPAEAEALLHALKGSALNLGFVDLAHLCREGQGTAASPELWLDRLARIAEVYAASKARLAALG
jgi:histidine phosphotransfer protein HptB